MTALPPATGACGPLTAAVPPGVLLARLLRSRSTSTCADASAAGFDTSQAVAARPPTGPGPTTAASSPTRTTRSSWRSAATRVADVAGRVGLPRGRAGRGSTAFARRRPAPRRGAGPAAAACPSPRRRPAPRSPGRSRPRGRRRPPRSPPALDRAGAARAIDRAAPRRAADRRRAGAPPASRRGETAYHHRAALQRPGRGRWRDWNGLGPDFAVREGQFLLIPARAGRRRRRSARPPR